MIEAWVDRGDGGRGTKKKKRRGGRKEEKINFFKFIS